MLLKQKKYYNPMLKLLFLPLYKNLITIYAKTIDITWSFIFISSRIL